jgi:excisionase family DNA binding protein
MDEFMTSAEVARLLGVGPTSVKRWADSGLLPCLRTPGRHRRFSRPEVEKFRLKQHEVQEPDPAQIDAWIKLIDSVCGPYEVHSALLFDRSRLDAWWRVSELVGAVLAEIGRRWEAGQMGILQEHLASERLARGLARCTESIAVPQNGPRALLVGAEGDEHTLGLQLAELVFRERGWNVLWGGRSMPTTEVVGRIQHGDCDLVAVSAAASFKDLSKLRDQVRAVGSACQEHDVQLILGGRAPWPEHASDLPRFHRVNNFRELHELLGSLHG